MMVGIFCEKVGNDVKLLRDGVLMMVEDDYIQ